LDDLRRSLHPPPREVNIIRDGARRIVVPADSPRDDFFAVPGVDIRERVQPAHQERERF
jgi:antitoxin VapB